MSVRVFWRGQRRANPSLTFSNVFFSTPERSAGLAEKKMF